MSEHDNTQPERSVDKLLEDLEAEKAARSREEERLGEVLKVDEHTAAKISEERKNKVSGFKLDIDLDEEFQKTEEPAPPSVPRARPSTKSSSWPPSSRARPPRRTICSRFPGCCITG